MLNEKDNCDYETSVALSELGCPIPKYATINIHTKEKEWKMWISLYDAQKWLREEKNIEANASFDKKDDGWIAFIQRLDYPDLCGTDVFSAIYDTYESALSESIKEAIKILKEENNEYNLQNS